MKAYGKLSLTINNKPEVYIEPLALNKMQLFVTHCDDEIGWLGVCIKTTEKGVPTYTIKDVLLFEQEVNGATCEIDESCMAKFAEELLMHEDGVEMYNNIRVWGHSHVNMEVSPSSQDETQFDKLIEGSDDYFIRIIANKKGDLKLDLHDKSLGITFNNVAWKEVYDKSSEFEVLREIKEKVKKKTYTRPSYGVKPSGYKSAYYDSYHGGYYATPQNDCLIDNVYELKKCEDLIDILGLSDEDVVMLSELDVVSCMEALNEATTNYEYIMTLNDAQYVLKLCIEFVEKYYRAI